MGIAALCSPCSLIAYDGIFSLNGLLVNSTAVWYLRFISYDYAGIAQDLEVMTVSLMHNVLYKTFVFETIFFNLYLLFGLVLAVGCLFLFKIWLNPAVVGRLFSLSRLRF